MPVSTGTHVGPYEILGLLGAGGVGEVYKARDIRLKRTVAIKVLTATLASDPSARERLLREARAVATLNHFHICTIHDVGQHDGFDYLVLEYLEGETLARRLQQGPLKLDEALKIAHDIADALDKAHRAGIVHRDLKPGNIMLTKGGVKLLDFGLAKLCPQAAVAAGFSTAGMQLVSSLTETGSIVGTLHYMAPEQLVSAAVDSRTDVFAFGAVLYEMVTGRKAFTGESHASLIGAILNDDPPSIRLLQPSAPLHLDRILQTCLAKDPDDRWQSAGDLTHQLRWLGGDPVPLSTTIPAAPARARRMRLLWLVAGALPAVALVVLLPLLVTQAREPPSVADSRQSTSRLSC